MSKVLSGAALLAIVASSSACFVARIPPAIGHTGAGSEARRFVDAANLSGSLVDQHSMRECRVQEEKYFDRHVCTSRLWQYGVVRRSERAAWAEIDERLVFDGWLSDFAKMPTLYRREGSDALLWLTVGEAVVAEAGDHAHAMEVNAAFDALGPGETLVGLYVSYQTPWDVLRTYTCWLGC